MLLQVKGNLLRNGKKRTDLFLIYPPWAALGRDTYLQNFLPPLGILTIAAYAESKGYSAHVFDIHGERADDLELRRRLRLTRPRFIGISVLTNMCVPAHKIAKICKEEMYLPSLSTTPNRSASPSLASPMSDEVDTTFCCSSNRFLPTGSGWSIPGNIGSCFERIWVTLFKLLEHKEDK